MKTINGKQLKEIFISGVNAIRNDSNRIDALNVFPVPDGDTGSNMSASTKYAADKLFELESKDISYISSKFARGMLLGARGNSGVILSQIFKGFSISLKEKKIATVFDIVAAFKKASKYAYKSVMSPVEGTMLTVIREISEKLDKCVTSSMSIIELFAIATNEARTSVDNTPNLLPVLKEAGVVDSGGEGLFKFIWAAAKHLEGKPTKYNGFTIGNQIFNKKEIYDGEFGYCIEFILTLKLKNSFNKIKFNVGLKKLGNSAVIVVDEDIVKLHIHSFKPGCVFNYAQKFGEFLKIKVENMSQQAFENKAASLIKNDNDPNELINISIISCNVGQGIINDMKKYGANFIIECSQSINPSTADIINAIKSVKSNKVIILPNNPNIILAAKQAAQTIKDKKVIVLLTKTQMQGLAAIINFDPDGLLADNKREMSEVIKEVGTIQITKSSKTTKIEGIKIFKNEYLSIANRKILGSYKNIKKAVIIALKSLINHDTEVVTIYYGDESTKADASEIVTFLDNNYDIEVEVKSGDQPIYNYLILIE